MKIQFLLQFYCFEQRTIISKASSDIIISNDYGEFIVCSIFGDFFEWQTSTTGSILKCKKHPKICKKYQKYQLKIDLY